ncbi:MAG: hypothetical protein PHX18_07170 [Candidatus Gastranaerophilales bacterium]|nr:hypothetical protein [Candidatus Gastranaerophilales bacterium]
MLKKISKQETGSAKFSGAAQNPIKHGDNECLNRLVVAFKEFCEFFDNDSVDKAIKHEFGKEYATLPLLIKERIYYENH